MIGGIRAVNPANPAIIYTITTMTILQIGLDYIVWVSKIINTLFVFGNKNFPYQHRNSSLLIKSCF